MDQWVIIALPNSRVRPLQTYTVPTGFSMPPRAHKQLNTQTGASLKTFWAALTEVWRNHGFSSSSFIPEWQHRVPDHQKGSQKKYLRSKSDLTEISEPDYRVPTALQKAIKQYGREHFRLTVLMSLIYLFIYLCLFLFSYKDPREHNVKVVVALPGICC